MEIVRAVDELGRIMLPIELRKRLEIDAKDKLSISVVDNIIVMKKIASVCRLCGSAENLAVHGSSVFCSKCVDTEA